MQISQLFEKLYAGARITLSFPDEKSFDNFYSQLRTSKSRYELKFQKVFGESLTAGQVVRVVKYEVVDGYTNELRAEFFLGPPKNSTIKKDFTILNITEPIKSEQAK